MGEKKRTLLTEAVARVDLSRKNANRLFHHPYQARVTSWMRPQPISKNSLLIKIKSEYASRAEEKDAVEAFGDACSALMGLAMDAPLGVRKNNKFKRIYHRASLMADSGAYRSSKGMGIVLNNVLKAYQYRARNVT